MITKSGKHHYKCDFSTYLRDGTLEYRREGFTFIARDAGDYIQRSKDAYAAHDITAVFENLIDLDA